MGVIVTNADNKRNSKQLMNSSRAEVIMNEVDYTDNYSGGRKPRDEQPLSPLMRLSQPTSREKLYLLLDDGSSSPTARAVSRIILITIIVSTISACLQTMPEYASCPIWDHIELCVTTVFTVEFVLKLLVHPHICSVWADFYFYTDLMAVVPWYVENARWLLGVEVPARLVFQLGVLRSLRMLKVMRTSSGTIILMEAMALCIPALKISFLYLLILMNLFSALFYHIEPEYFESQPQALWFVVVTMTTLGYGDYVPQCALAKCLDAIVMCCGLLFMAMPLTIVGTYFWNVWDEKDKVVLVYYFRRSMMGTSVSALYELFRVIDKDGSGELDLDEFQQAIKALRLPFTGENVRQLFEIIDVDGSGSFNFMEFMTVVFPKVDMSNFRSPSMCAAESPHDAVSKTHQATSSVDEGTALNQTTASDPVGDAGGVREGYFYLKELESLRQRTKSMQEEYLALTAQLKEELRTRCEAAGHESPKCLSTEVTLAIP